MAFSLFMAVFSAEAQTNLVIYADGLLNGFQDWSWAADNLDNPSPVYSGKASIAVYPTAWEGLAFEHADMSTSPYTNLSFWINGGAGGQVIQVQALLGAVVTANTYQMSALPASNWQQMVIPLTALGIANQPNFDRFWLQVTDSGTTNPFYVDDVELVASPAPNPILITVNTAKPVRTVDARYFGINTAIWDGYFDTAETVLLLNESGLRALRFPGGSASDDYDWASNTSGTNTWQWATSFDDFAQVVTNVGAQAIITVNYGTGTPAEAAAWVANSKSQNYGFKYWEIGNECYGSWETDSNTYPHDPYTYATRAAQYLQQMRAADPTIHIGVVVVPGETVDSNGYTNHPAYNPRTGRTNYGWTAVLLTTLKNLGVTPDFAIHHWYPEYTDTENDATLLQGTGVWTGAATDLRQQLTDYFGSGGTNIELLCTENNSNAGAQGKQSVSLVNGLYYADSLAQIMQTEFNSFIWWDLRNGIDNSGNLSASLYGWRQYGDIGMLDGLGDVLANRYPHFYTAKLLQYFARAGDTVLTTGSDYTYLSAYSVRSADGALTVLAINKSPTATYTAQLALGGFTASSNVTLRSYGMPQDNAAETDIGSPDIAATNLAVTSTNYNYNFAPYSASVLTFYPSAPSLAALASLPVSNAFVMRLQGQPGVPYLVQTSTNLLNWTTVSTFTLVGSSLNITNALSHGVNQRFWRAVWEP